MVPLPHVTSITRICIIQDFGHMLKVTGCFEKDLGLYTKPSCYPVLVLHCSPTLHVSLHKAPSHTLLYALGWGYSSLASRRAWLFAKVLFYALF